MNWIIGEIIASVDYLTLINYIFLLFMTWIGYLMARLWYATVDVYVNVEVMPASLLIMEPDFCEKMDIYEKEDELEMFMENQLEVTK